LKGKRLRNTLNSTILEAIKSWKLEVEKAAAIEVGSMDHDLHDLLNPEKWFLTFNITERQVISQTSVITVDNSIYAVFSFQALPCILA